MQTLGNSCVWDSNSTLQRKRETRAIQFNAPRVFDDTHLLLASLEPSVHEPAGLLWQKRRRCGHWPGPGPPRPARPPGSRCIGPCVAGAPEEAEVESHVMPSVEVEPWLIHPRSPTSSMYSGSEAEASQRLLRMKIFGLESRSFTLWKNDFSWKKSESFNCGRKKTTTTYFESVKKLHQKRATEQTDHILYVYFITSYRLHQCGFRVCYQDKHISVQAEFVDPAVQFCGHVNPGAARENLDNVRPQRKSDLRMSECYKLKHVSKNKIIGKSLLPTDTS